MLTGLKMGGKYRDERVRIRSRCRTVHRALDAVVKGDAGPAKALYSRSADVTLANPFGPPVRGWAEVAATADRAAANYRDGAAQGFHTITKYVTPELAYLVELERFTSRIGGRQDPSEYALRATTIFRPEDDTWKILHRHADFVTAPPTG
jgi:ketosteroid isomerase-like protein